jgi:molybdopterin-guanine dinucleotide biosynthesis protein B
VEGLKNSGLPKVEIIKDAQSSKSICTKETLLAIVTDKPDVAEGVPSFRKEEVNQLAELLKKYIEQEKQKRRIQND